jgi:thiamine biosynthesis protein ThiI
MGLVLLRYGEIALKGKNRAYFYRKLRRNVRKCLKANDIDGTVWQEGQRIYLETEQVEEAVAAVQRVFGIVSLSPVRVTPPDMDAITGESLALARHIGLDPNRTFKVRVRRADKAFPLISPQIERQVGETIAEATGARPDLSKAAQVTVGIEIHPGRALIFGERFPGPGGLPLDSQGRVVSLLSSGIDSPVASWLMMKRGCSVIPVHFSVSQAQTEQVQAIVAALNRHAYGWQIRPIILSHQEILEPTLARLREIRRERWTCLFCKRALLTKAAEIAEEMGAGALVTGDSLGQVASQTLTNLEVISYGIQKPILRPLIGMDKTEIMDLARRIGTYELSTREAHTCPFLPDRPLTQASVAKLRGLLDQMAQIGEPPLTSESATSESATSESATSESATSESATSESATSESATSESAAAKNRKGERLAAHA